MSGYVQEVLALLAVNVVLTYGAFLPMAAGRLNLGVAGLAATGAYASAFLSNATGCPPIAAALAAAVFTALLGAIIAVPLVRVRGVYFTLATLALGQVLQSVILNLDVVGASTGYPVKTFLHAYTLLLCAVVVTGLVVLLFHTRFGISVAAVSDDELTAELMGLPVHRIQIAAFALGAGIAALAGALYAHHFSYIEAQSYGIVFSIYVVLCVVLGGTQTAWGPLVSAAVFTFLPEFLGARETWRYAIFAIAILAVVMWRPEGLITSSLLRWRPRASPLVSPVEQS